MTSVRPAKTRIRLGGCPVWSESSLCAQWVAKDLLFLHGDSKDSDQTGRMPRLIGVFAGRTWHIVGFVVTRLTLKTVFILLIIICITTFSKIVYPGQNMQQTFLKFVEIYFCLCQKYKIGFCMGKIETKGNHFCRKIQLPIKTRYQKKSTQNVIKALPVVIKTFESNSLKGDPLEIQHPKFENSRLGLIESVHER